MPVPARKLKSMVDDFRKKKGQHDDDEEQDDPKQKKDKGRHGGGDDDGDDGDDGPDDAELQKYVDEEGDKVNDGKQDGQLRKLMRDFDPDENPPKWAASKSKWSRAKEAVDPEGDGAEKYDEPWAVVVHVYKRMGGKIKGRED